MNYRIEFLAEDCDNTVPTTLDHARFPTFLRAVSAARLGVGRLTTGDSASVIVRIFDRHDQLASRLQIAVSGGA